MTSLNIGCGGDPFGDFRLDVRREGTYANIIADAQNLPFKNEVFSYICAFDVLEHVSVHPKIVLGEWTRTCKAGGVVHTRTPSWHFYQLLIETFALPFRLWDAVKAGQPLHIISRVCKLMRWKQRMSGSIKDLRLDEDEY